jgi:hypothetical protein
MDSIASRIVKAHQYAQERDSRIRVRSLEVEVRGEHSTHIVRYTEGRWVCDCEEFKLRGVCAHIMALEEILGDAVQPAVVATPAH